MLKKNLFRSFLLSLSLLISACATKAPDVPVCTELSLDRGFCTYTISNKSYFVDEKNKLDGKTWWEIRPTMIYVPYASYAELKKFIITMCKRYNQCSEVTNWQRTLDVIDVQLIEKNFDSRLP